MFTRVVVGASATIFILLPLLHCSSSSSSGDACTQYYNAALAYAQRCEGVTDTRSAEAQRSDFLQRCSNIVSAPGASNFAGALSACASQIGSSCAGSDCEIDPVGTLADGAACLTGTQCASGFCDGQNSACGHCVAAVAVGQPCTTASRCAKDSYCDTSTGKNVCVAIVRAKQGESCRGGSGGAVACEKGLNCVAPDGTADYVCLAPGVANAPCSGTSDCQAPFTCSKGVCGDAVPAGGTCGTGEGCARGLGCGPDKKCVQIAFVATGQPCDSVHKCINGRCKGATSIGDDDDDDDGTTSPSSAVCEAYLALGAPCTDTSTSSSQNAPRCSTYASCVSGTCQIPDANSCK